jgi:hypothetical protein
MAKNKICLCKKDLCVCAYGKYAGWAFGLLAFTAACWGVSQLTKNNA